MGGAEGVNPIYGAVLICPKANAVYESNLSNQTKEFCYPILIYGIMSSTTGICLERWPREKRLRPSYLSTIYLFSRRSLYQFVHTINA